MSRYADMFARLQARNEGAFVPFVTLGDPNPELSLEIVRCLVAAGADALELGLPFSDPVADGPTIQRANIRALASGTKRQHCFEIIRQIRAEYPDLPIGLLVYANLVASHPLHEFYQQCADAGVDSVLVADVPAREGKAFSEAAKAAGIAPIYIAPPDASAERLATIAAASEGYVYLLSRAGVTGAETQMQTPTHETIEQLKAYDSAPPLLGFGIAQPEHVHAALSAGAAGAISGSAVVQRIEQYQHEPERLLAELSTFVKSMKAATSNL